MSLKRNILANYLSQIYVTLIGIITVPLYIRYMGAEAYGLIGFFAVLQAWFNLLDMGLSSTVARETARFRGGASDALRYRRLVRALETIFFIVAAGGAGVVLLTANFIARDWLVAPGFPVPDLRMAIQLMGLIAALRWMSGLYRGVIAGSERLVWLGGANALIATLRFIGVLPVLVYVGATPFVFFAYQLGVAILEVVVLVVRASGLLPGVPASGKVAWSLAPLRDILAFSVTVAFTSSIGILVSQSDKLILSKLLPLADYGYYTLGVLVAGSVLILGGPISTAIMPRMSRLEAEADHRGVIEVYRNATQLMCVVALPVALMLAAFAEPVLAAWTRDPVAAREAAPIVQLYALGNALFSLVAFPYYLQYAKGQLRLHLIGVGGFLLLLVPALILTALKHGAVGAGWTWLVLNLLAFAMWVPFIHSRFAPGLHWTWLTRDVGAIALVSGASTWLVRAISGNGYGHVELAGRVLASGLLVLAAAAMASTAVRARIMNALLAR